MLTGLADETPSSLWANIFLCACLNSSISCNGETNDQRFVNKRVKSPVLLKPRVFTSLDM